MCTPSARALRGSPASITATDRRERPRVTPAFKPAAPPPMTTASNFSSGCCCCVIMPSSVRSLGEDWQALLPIWQTSRMDELDAVLTAVGPRLKALRHRGDTTLADL